MKIINKQLLDTTSDQAKTSPRLRMNYNFHVNENATINRLINAMEPGSYIRPHRHLNPDKEEIFLILRGKVGLLLFDDNGNIIEKLALDPEAGTYGAEIEPGTWHSVIILTENTIIYEIKEGPFHPLPKENFAPWSPEPENKEEVKSFISYYQSLFE